MTTQDAVYILRTQTRRINTTADAHDQMKQAIDLLERHSEELKLMAGPEPKTPESK